MDFDLNSLAEIVEIVVVVAVEIVVVVEVVVEIVAVEVEIVVVEVEIVVVEVEIVEIVEIVVEEFGVVVRTGASEKRDVGTGFALAGSRRWDIAVSVAPCRVGVMGDALAMAECRTTDFRGCLGSLRTGSEAAGTETSRQATDPMFQ